MFKTIYDRVVLIAMQLHTKLAITLFSNDPSFDSMSAQLGKSLRVVPRQNWSPPELTSIGLVWVLKRPSLPFLCGLVFRTAPRQTYWYQPFLRFFLLDIPQIK